MNHPQQQESWSSFTVEGGGYIEFKDEENQKKCMALIQELISTKRQRVIEEVRGLVEGMKEKHIYHFEKLHPSTKMASRYQHNLVVDGIYDDLLCALKEMEEANNK